jgi:ATP-dependent protease HslVU (ClpYQ) peptidase subunit
MAADSRGTLETESGGARFFRCEKMYRKTIKVGKRTEEHIIGVAGETSPALVFLDWYGSGKDVPEVFALMNSDFMVLIYNKHGLFEADAYCRPERVLEKFWSIGSGCKAALGAMHAGADAKRACFIATKVEHFSSTPITTMSLTRKK